MQCGAKLDDDATVIAGDAAADSVDSESDDIPKTRIAKNLDEFLELSEGEDPAKTRIYQSAAEARINPKLIQINDDSSEGTSYDITKKRTILGRSSGDITYPADTYLSPEHAAFQFSDDKMIVEDLDTFNGIFYKINERTELYDDAFILMGQQLLKFRTYTPEDLDIPLQEESEEIFNYYGASSKKIVALLIQIYSNRAEGNRYYITHDTVFIGRQSGDISFPDDKFMSNRHAILSHERGKFYIEDNGSSNGVFIQIKKKLELEDNDHLLIGKQLFKYRAPIL
jgi:hypothetical protein